MDFAKFLKKSSDIYKQIYSEKTDEKIIEESTGKGPKPKDNIIVKTFTDKDTTIKIIYWKKSNISNYYYEDSSKDTLVRKSEVENVNQDRGEVPPLK